MLSLVSGCEKLNALRNAPQSEQVVETDNAVVDTSWSKYVKDNKALVAYSIFTTVLAIGAIAAAIIFYNKSKKSLNILKAKSVVEKELAYAYTMNKNVPNLQEQIKQLQKDMEEIVLQNANTAIEVFDQAVKQSWVIYSASQRIAELEQLVYQETSQEEDDVQQLRNELAALRQALHEEITKNIELQRKLQFDNTKK